MADHELEPLEGDVLLAVLDGEFGLYLAWGTEIAAKAPPWGGAPLPERMWQADASFVSQLLAQGMPHANEAAVFRLDDESRSLLENGGRLAIDDSGNILPQIYEDGHQGVRRKARLVEVDDEGVPFDAAVITAAVQEVIDRYEQQLARYEEEVAAQATVLHKVLLLQFGTASADLDAHLSILGELIALVRDGQHLDALECNLAVQAERDANAAVALAVSQLSRLWELASEEPLTNSDLRDLADVLEHPETEFWLQHYTRGKILAYMSLALQLYGRADMTEVRAGVLRQRMQNMSSDWAERLGALDTTMKTQVRVDERRILGVLQRGRARQLESRMDKLSSLYEVISSPVNDMRPLLPGFPALSAVTTSSPKTS